MIERLTSEALSCITRSAVNTQILLVDCSDEIGLVHRITGVLYRHGCNIVSNSEFVDAETARFFMRTEFAAERATEQLVQDVRDLLPVATVRLANPEQRKIVVLATKEHHVLGELLLRHAYAELGASIAAVISNHATLGPLVEKFGLPFHHVSHEGRDRLDHEAAVAALIERYAAEYIVLAKYMRVLSPAFVARYPQRIINIHHSFLPAFIGANPYRQAFQRGVKIIGATAHFVTDDLDEGPIIAQDVIAVDHSYGPAAMTQAGRDVEKLVLAKALRLVFEERVFLNGKRTIIFE